MILSNELECSVFSFGKDVDVYGVKYGCSRFITYYISVVHSSGYRWNAKRRYRDFLSLREKLIGIGFDKTVPFPKKILKIYTKGILESRKSTLDFFLRKAIEYEPGKDMVLAFLAIHIRQDYIVLPRSMFTLDEVEITGSYDPRGYVADDNDKGDYFYTLRDDSFDNGSSSHHDSSHTSVEEIILEQEDTSNSKDRLPGKDDPQELHQSISSISPQISDPAILEHDTEAAETIEDPSFPVSDSTDGINRSFKEHIQQLNQTVFSNTTAGESIDEKIVLKQGVLLKMDVEAFIKEYHIRNNKTRIKALTDLYIHDFSTHPMLTPYVSLLLSHDTITCVSPLYEYDLRYILQRRVLLTEEEVLYLSYDILLLLEDFQKKNICLRSLSPEHLLLDYNGYILLTGMGYASLSAMDTSGCKGTTGSYYYMAPEVLFSDQTFEEYGYLADMYSLGVLIYECLYGCLPFGTKIDQEYLTRMMNDDISYPSLPKPSSRCLDVLRLLLQSTPSKRPSAAQLLNYPWYSWIDQNDILLRKGKQLLSLVTLS